MRSVSSSSRRCRNRDVLLTVSDIPKCIAAVWKLTDEEDSGDDGGNVVSVLFLLERQRIYTPVNDEEDSGDDK